MLANWLPPACEGITVGVQVFNLRVLDLARGTGLPIGLAKGVEVPLTPKIVPKAHIK